MFKYRTCHFIFYAVCSEPKITNGLLVCFFLLVECMLDVKPGFVFGSSLIRTVVCLDMWIRIDNCLASRIRKIVLCGPDPPILMPKQ